MFLELKETRGDNASKARLRLDWPAERVLALSASFFGSSLQTRFELRPLNCKGIAIITLRKSPAILELHL